MGRGVGERVLGDDGRLRPGWEGKDLGKVSEATGVVAAHGVLLLELKK